MTDWKRSWKSRTETKSSASEKRKLKKQTHKANRRISKFELRSEDGNHRFYMDPNGWDVI